MFLLVSFHAPNNLFEDYLVWQADIVQSIFVISKTLEFRYYEYRYVINFIGRLYYSWSHCAANKKTFCFSVTRRIWVCSSVCLYILRNRVVHANVCISCGFVRSKVYLQPRSCKRFVIKKNIACALFCDAITHQNTNLNEPSKSLQRPKLRVFKQISYLLPLICHKAQSCTQLSDVSVCASGKYTCTCTCTCRLIMNDTLTSTSACRSRCLSSSSSSSRLTQCDSRCPNIGAVATSHCSSSLTSA